MGDKTIKLLFVEDDHEYAKMISLLLKDSRSAQFNFKSAGTLDSALQSLIKEPFDLILLDLFLPDCEGLDTFRLAHAQAPDLPIVVMTGFADKELALEAVREGAQDFLVKGETDINRLVSALQYALERNQMISNLKRLSLIDELTGLLNRRGFMSLAKQHLKIAQRANRNLLLFFADLDGLKEINDTFGHLEGDQALKQVAMILKSTFRSSDLVARLGGDEFTILAVDAPKNNAQTMSIRLLENIDRYNAQSPCYQLSLSVGAAKFDSQSETTLDELLTKADRSLYDQKRNRKNTICST